jgi:pyridoxine/pyridoxamine 5'-phosphate oxidase
MNNNNTNNITTTTTTTIINPVTRLLKIWLPLPAHAREKNAPNALTPSTADAGRASRIIVVITMLAVPRFIMPCYALCIIF